MQYDQTLRNRKGFENKINSEVEKSKIKNLYNE